MKLSYALKKLHVFDNCQNALLSFLFIWSVLLKLPIFCLFYFKNSTVTLLYRDIIFKKGFRTCIPVIREKAFSYFRFSTGVGCC